MLVFYVEDEDEEEEDEDGDEEDEEGGEEGRGAVEKKFV